MNEVTRRGFLKGSSRTVVGFAAGADGFFDKHCVGCHGADSPKANIRLDDVLAGFADDAGLERWDLVLEMLDSGAMPPDGEPQPAVEEREAAMRWLKSRLRDAIANAERTSATPAPSLDLTAWERTLDEIEIVGPERAGVAHFGMHGDPTRRTAALRTALTTLEARVSRAMADGTVQADAAAFHEEVVERLSPFRPGDAVGEYFQVFSAANDYLGMAHHLKRRTPKDSPP